jgi:hypothetical protein
MTFVPVVPFVGYSGWRFLERTLEPQQAAFAKSQPIVRETDYFRDNIGKVMRAEDLVDDRRLLSVALGAFGLDDDIDNRFFIRRVLEDGTINDGALANRLADSRYADFSRAFGFGDRSVPRTITSGFATDLITRYEYRRFEKEVGVQSNDLRLALNLKSGLSDVLGRNSSDGARWFSMMGNSPLRKVFETALGLPSSIASIDIDKQRDIFKSRAQATFGTADMANFANSAQQEKLIRLFLVRSEAAQSGAVSGASTALTLLQSMPRISRKG